MQIFKKKLLSTEIHLLPDIPCLIVHRPNQPAQMQMSDGKEYKAACLHCVNKHCMFFCPDELDLTKIDNFPIDKNNCVCPVQAIYEEDDGSVNIDQEKCIMCGACVKRCPIGAIFAKQNEMLVNKDGCRHIISKHNQISARKHEEQILALSNVTHTGTIVAETDKVLISVYNKLSQLDSRYHNIIIRNILISMGYKTGKSRTGDVYTRMDLVCELDPDNISVIEVEFGQETLDASRAILEDIAVTQEKYSLPKEKNYPLVICLSLPNSRQGYWQVIKDIKNVENIKIQTLSVGALLLLNWNNKPLSLSDCKYYVDFDDKSLRQKLEQIIGKDINLSHTVLGILEPFK